MKHSFETAFSPKVPYQEPKILCSKWDKFYLELCMKYSEMSKDPSTKVGSCIVRPDRTLASCGYNGFCRQMKDNPERYCDRNFKIQAIIHGEINALIHAREQVKGYTVYTTPGLSCPRCTVQLLEAGIDRFVSFKAYGSFGERWGKDIELSKSFMEEAKASYTEIDINTWEVVTDFNPNKDPCICDPIDPNLITYSKMK